MFSLPRLASRALRPTLRTASLKPASPRRPLSTSIPSPQKASKYLIGAGAAASISAAAYFLLPTIHADAAPSLDRSLIPAPSAGYPPGPEPKVEQIESGSTHVPTFPNRLFLTTNQVGEDLGGEYACMGLGVRMVTFMRAHVYVVGFYVHVDDLGELQRRLVECMHPDGGASMCTPQEREHLQGILNGGAKSAEFFNRILGPDAEGKTIRSAFRIMPSRNTRLNHLRDGWVRGINGKMEEVVPEPVPGEEIVLAGEMGRFKDIFREGNRQLLRGQTMLLTRGSRGELSVWLDVTGRNDGFFGNGKGVPEVAVDGYIFDEERIGGVEVEKFTRALWMCYLGGKKVSSGQARERIVEMMVQLTGKPLGTPTLMTMYS